MSQGTALGKDDLFEKDVFKDAITGAQTFLTVIRDTKEEIKQSLTIQKEFVSTFKAKSFDDVKKLNQELKQTSDLIKMKQQLEIAEIKVMEQQEKLAQTQIKTAIEKNRLNQQQLKSEVELTKAIEAETKANEKAQKSLNQLNGEYKKGVKDLANLKQQLKELKFNGQENTEVFKRLNSEMLTLDKRVFFILMNKLLNLSPLIATSHSNAAISCLNSNCSMYGCEIPKRSTNCRCMFSNALMKLDIKSPRFFNQC